MKLVFAVVALSLLAGVVTGCSTSGEQVPVSGIGESAGSAGSFPEETSSPLSTSVSEPSVSSPKKLSPVWNVYADKLLPVYPVVKKWAERIDQCTSQNRFTAQAKEKCVKAATVPLDVYGYLMLLLPAPDTTFDCQVLETRETLKNSVDSALDLRAWADGTYNGNHRIDVIFTRAFNSMQNAIFALKGWQEPRTDWNPEKVGCG